MKTKIFIGLVFSALILLSFTFVTIGENPKDDHNTPQTAKGQLEQPVGGFALDDGF